MAREIKEEVRRDVEKIVSAGNRPPRLTVILVGDNPASKSYISNKFKAAKYTGKVLSVITLLIPLPDDKMLDQTKLKAFAKRILLKI